MNRYEKNRMWDAAHKKTICWLFERGILSVEVCK